MCVCVWPCIYWKLKRKKRLDWQWYKIQLLTQINRHGYKNICDRLDVSWWRKIEPTTRMFILSTQAEDREEEREERVRRWWWWRRQRRRQWRQRQRSCSSDASRTVQKTRMWIRCWCNKIQRNGIKWQRASHSNVWNCESMFTFVSFLFSFYILPLHVRMEWQYVRN